MSRGTLLIAALTVFSAVFGQGQTATPSTTTAPANEPFGGPILVTPSTAFPNPVPTAGISVAGRAGISNATNGSDVTTGSANPGTGLATPGASLSEVTASPSGVTDQGPTELGTSTLVRGPSDESGTSIGGASEASGASTISLAEVSNRYKAEKGTRNAKVLGNEDVQAMLNNKSGMTMAKNMPPLGSGALEQSGSAPSTDTQSATQSAQENQQNGATKSSANQPAQTAATGQAGTTQPAANGQSADNGVNAENSTTPQINQKQQSNDAQGSRRLPATATFLPLLSLLGLVSGGIGLWFRKFRN
ncbi:MAG TPA: hypothetical protein VE054_12880 [Blattabacteriaceae bacterium]|nr:hypothetical protein [Blattabacteriaceae bacterium]